MAKFCSSCGAPVGEDLNFCAQCGKAVTSVAYPAGAASTLGTSPVAPNVTSVASKGSNSTTKIIVGLLAFFAAMAVFAAASFVYVGYRVHKKIQEVRQEFPMQQFGAAANGNTSGPGSSSDSSSTPKGARPDCSLITQEEMGAVLATPISDVVHRAGECEYIPQGNKSGLKIKPEWAGGRTGMGFLKGIAQPVLQAKFGALTAPMESIPGLGDEAYSQYGMLYVRKDDVMVTIDTNSVISHDQEIAIARKIVPRM